MRVGASILRPVFVAGAPHPTKHLPRKDLQHAILEAFLARCHLEPEKESLGAVDWDLGSGQVVR